MSNEKAFCIRNWDWVTTINIRNCMDEELNTTRILFKIIIGDYQIEVTNKMSWEEIKSKLLEDHNIIITDFK